MRKVFFSQKLLGRSLLGVASTALGFACVGGSATSPDRPPVRDNSPVQTDSVVYHLQRLASEYRAYVVASYVNRTSSAVYFARCNRESTVPMYSIRRTGADSSRTFFTDIFWACVGGVPTGQIAPGDSTMVRVILGSLDQPTMTPPLKPEDLVGLMRVELTLCRTFTADSDYCDPVLAPQRVSNAFLVSY